MAQNIRQKIIINAIDKSKVGFDSVKQNSNSLNNALNRVRNTVLGLFAGNVVGDALPSLIRFSDTTIELDGRLKIVAEDTENYIESQRALARISLETNSNLQANQELYTRLAIPLKNLSYETSQVADLTEVMATGLRLGGASAAESSSVILQLSQALGSGLLRGEEFNAISEASIPIMTALAKGLDKPIGALRGMADQGKLTSKIVIDALLSQRDSFREQLKEMPLTVTRAFENIRTQFSAFILANKGFVTSIAGGLQSVANNFDTIVTGIEVLAVLIAGKLIAATVAYIVKINAQIAASRLLKIENADRARQERAIAIKKERDDAAALITANKKAVAEAKNAFIRKQIAADDARLAAQKRVDDLRALQDELKKQQSHQRALSLAHQRRGARARSRTAQKVDEGLTLKLTAAKKELSRAEVKLNTTLNSEAAAHSRVNSAINTSVATTNRASASSAVLAHQTGKLSKSGTKMNLSWGGMAAGLSRSFGGLFSLVKGGFALMGGWIGVGLAAFTYFTSQVENAELLILAFKKSIAKVYQEITSFGDRIFGGKEKLPQIKKESEELDKFYDKEADKIIRRQSNLDAVEKQLAADKEKRDAAQHQRRITAVANEKQALKDIGKATKKLLMVEVKGQKDYTTSVLRNMKARQSAAKAETELRLANTAKLISNKEDAIRQRALLDFEANKAIIEETKSTIDELLASNEKFYNSKQKMVEDGSRQSIELDVAQKESAKKLYSYLITEVNKVNDKNKTLYKNSLKEVRQFTSHLENLQKSSSDFLFNLEKENMSNAELASHSRQKILKIEGELNALNTLDQVKDAKQIQDSRDDLMDQLKEVILAEKSRAKDFKSGSKDQLDAQNNVNQALTDYKDVVGDAIQADENGIKASSARASKVASEISARNDELVKYQSAIDKLDDQLEIDRVLMVDINTEAAHKALDDLENSVEIARRQIEANPIIITTKHVQEGAGSQTKQTGGVIDESTPDKPLLRNTGGYTPMQGKVSGINSGDRQRALLEAGEYVVRKSVVDKLGVKYFNQLNFGIDPLEIPKKSEEDVVSNDETPSVIHRRGGGIIDDIDRGEVGTKIISGRAKNKTGATRVGINEQRSVGRWQDKWIKDLESKLSEFTGDKVDDRGRRDAEGLGREIISLLESTNNPNHFQSVNEYNSTLTQLVDRFSRFDSILVSSKERIIERTRIEKETNAAEKAKIKADKEQVKADKAAEKAKIKADKAAEKAKIKADKEREKQLEIDRARVERDNIAITNLSRVNNGLAPIKAATDSSVGESNSITKLNSSTESLVKVDGRDYKVIGDKLMDVQTGTFIDNPNNSSTSNSSTSNSSTSNSSTSNSSTSNSSTSNTKAYNNVATPNKDLAFDEDKLREQIARDKSNPDSIAVRTLKHGDSSAFEINEKGGYARLKSDPNRVKIGNQIFKLDKDNRLTSIKSGANYTPTQYDKSNGVDISGLKFVPPKEPAKTKTSSSETKTSSSETESTKRNVFTGEKKLKDKFSDYGTQFGSFNESAYVNAPESIRNNARDDFNKRIETQKADLEAQFNAEKARRDKIEADKLAAIEAEKKAKADARAKEKADREAERKEKADAREREKKELAIKRANEKAAREREKREKSTSVKSTSTTSVLKSVTKAIVSTSSKLATSFAPVTNSVENSQQRVINNNSRLINATATSAANHTNQRPVVLNIGGHELRGNFDDTARTKQILADIATQGAVK